MKEFLKKTPTLSGNEEVVAKAGQDIDPWSMEDQRPTGFLVVNMTEQYRELLSKLHMVNISLHKELSLEEKMQCDRQVELANEAWKKIQEAKRAVKKAAMNKIEKAWYGYTQEEIQKGIEKNETN